VKKYCNILRPKNILKVLTVQRLSAVIDFRLQNLG
jgi:hypothetical protein